MNPTPKAGENYDCPRCGFALTITADCACDNMHGVSLKCCNAEMELETEEKKEAKAAKTKAAKTADKAAPHAHHATPHHPHGHGKKD